MGFEITSEGQVMINQPWFSNYEDLGALKKATALQFVFQVANVNKQTHIL